MISSLFRSLCPNCGGDIEAQRLFEGLPCERCLPRKIERSELCQVLPEGELKKICEIEMEVLKWEESFRKSVGSDPWSLQRSWARKVLLGRSFALLAPTGVGKTTFGVITSIFLAAKGRRVYLVVPTKLLLEQIGERLISAGCKREWLLTADAKTQKEKNELKERISKGDYRVLLTTSMFLYRNFELIREGGSFDFIFVDDVDSFLKTAKNIDKVLMLIGFSESQITTAQELIALKEKRNKVEEDWNKIRELSKKVQAFGEDARGVLVVSSATSNPRSSRVKLFRELLGFEVGRPQLFMRNVEDLYEEPADLDSDLVSWVKRLGKGGLVFVSSDRGREGVEKVIKLLKKEGIRAKSYEEIGDLGDFERGKVHVLVGISSFRNPLARGLDMPQAVRYALFYGVPKIVIHLKLETSVSHLLWALLSIRPIIVRELKDEVKKVDEWIRRLRRYSFVSEEFIKRTPDLEKRIKVLRDEIREFLLSERVRELIDGSEEVTLKREGRDYILTVADVTGYLQASGRTSRMYAGGITKGLSIILVDDNKAFNNLVRKVRWFNEEVRFIRAKEVNLSEILRVIDDDRKKVRDILSGKVAVERKEHIKPVLIVVESPNKARTIASFFGKPIARRFGEFEVLEVTAGNLYIMITSSLGHILDLATEPGFHGVVVSNGEFVPVYEVIEGKEVTINGLRHVGEEVDEVYIATDPDTEGEKIGWDVAGVLMPFVKSVRRIEFHEVTRKAIKKAIETPRGIDENLVKAQVVRRVSDRWVGFEVSRILQSVFDKSWLSGGRVQIPVLGWIIERERGYRKKKQVVSITFREQDRYLRLDFEFPSREEAKKFFNKLKKITVEVLQTYEESLSPPPPFTTDTLLKEADDRFRFGAGKIMSLAQDLFERGLITYHRTDSTRVSDAGMGVAREFIEEEFGNDFVKLRRWGEGGAHECIRPTRPMDPEELRSVILSGQFQDLTRDHVSLYSLIFSRFMASQMRECRVRTKRVRISAGEVSQEKVLRTEVIEKGFNLLWAVELSPDLEGEIDVSKLKSLNQIPSSYLFTQGSLVQEMKKRGIGRPSTYASTVEKLLERGYVIQKNGFLIPTKLGKEVYEFLKNQERIMPFVSEEFTRVLEEYMDQVEEGKRDYREILESLFRDIIKLEESVRRN
jgi:reverse gyrase